MKAQPREYTGTWIPAYVMEDKDLTPTQKILYAEIASFKKCYAGNEFLANRLQLSIRGLQDALAVLKTKGYILVSGSTSKRILRASGTTTLQRASLPTTTLQRGKLPRSTAPIDNIEITNSTNVELSPNPLLEKALSDFRLHRKQLKRPLTPRAEELIKKRLAAWYPGSIDKQVAAVDQSIEMGWQGVFELKEDPRDRSEMSRQKYAV